MKILAIESSCDETAISIAEARGDVRDTGVTILGNVLNSQADKHAEFGGVYPSLAKREHAKNIIPLLAEVLREAGSYTEESQTLSEENKTYISEILKREPELASQMLNLLETVKKPDLDYLAVTEGPGLDPALWIGINVASILSTVWGIPLIPVNHMEGHIVSSLLDEKNAFGHVEFPALSLLISGGHTEIVLMKDWFDYELVGTTRDDAVGEAFDKAARMLGLPYPGGPEISRLADEARKSDIIPSHKLPRPMLHSDNCDFSFSGLKTAVLYTLNKLDNITEQTKLEFAREFEDAVVEILIKKVKKAIDENGAKTLIIGGGVSANNEIRKAFTNMIEREYKEMTLFLPQRHLSTDNAVMIAIAGLLRAQHGTYVEREIKAQSNLSLSGNK